MYEYKFTLFFTPTIFLQVHEFDELRFDIRGHECTYFLRASSVDEKDSWVEAIEGNKVRNQPQSQPML